MQDRNTIVTCDLCEKQISRIEAEEAEMLVNTMMTICLECADKTLHPERYN